MAYRVMEVDDANGVLIGIGHLKVVKTAYRDVLGHVSWTHEAIY